MNWIFTLVLIYNIMNERENQIVVKYRRQIKRASAKIKQKNYDLHSLRCDLGYKLDIAREFQHDVMTKNRIDK